MSADSVEVVRRAFTHFIAKGEPDWARLGEQIVTHDHDILDAGHYCGHEGHRRWLEDWSAAWSNYTIGDASEYIDAGDDVVLIFGLTATGRASGVTVAREDAMVCRVEGGQIVRLDYYNNPSEALAQVGLER